MANYLQPSASRPASVQSAASAGVGSIPDIDGAYTTEIIAEDDGKQSFVFKGYIPEDFNFDLDSNWSPQGGINEFAQDALNSATRGVAGAVQQGAFGGRPVFKQGSYQTWEGPSYLGITLPFELVAWSSGKEDVLDPIIAMLSLVTPLEQDNGLLLPPGLSPLEAALGNSGGPGEFKGRRISVRIGDFFFMDKNEDPALITNVSTAVESQFEVGTGVPISATMNVNIISYYPMTDKSVQRIFRAGGR